MKHVKPSPVVSNVMAQISQNKVTMLPKTYFLLITALGLIGSIFSGLVASYLVSILAYWLRIQTADTMARGARNNLTCAVDTFPWWALPTIVIVYSTTVWLIRRQSRMYRLRPAAIVIAVIGISLAIGMGMSYLGIGPQHSSDHYQYYHDHHTHQGLYPQGAQAQ